MLFCFLGLYTWNARTGYLDTLAEGSGLEISGLFLRPVIWARETVLSSWERYFALVGVAEENNRLRAELRQAEEDMAYLREERAELARLRALLGINSPEERVRLGARVLAGRFGPGAALESIMIDRGYATGAAPRTPLLTHQGLVGRVQRAAARTSTALLLTDRSFRVAVISQEGRVPGILAGNGADADLELLYVPLNTEISVGDLLITSGLDGEYPKGIPVAKVSTVQLESNSLFRIIRAAPVVKMDELEEVGLLAPGMARHAIQPIMAELPEQAPEEEAETTADGGTE